MGGVSEEARKLESLRARTEWFRQYHADGSGFIPSERRVQAIEHTSKMERVALSDLDPAEPPPETGFDLIGEAKIRTKLGAVKNPRPQSSLGFASPAVHISEPADLAGTVLRIALAKDAAARVESATIRVFIFDDETREWQLVVRSGASASGEYAWARPHRPGIYVAVGLPTDALVFSSVLALQSHMSWLRAATETHERRRRLGLIRNIVFSEPMTKQAAGGERPLLGDNNGEPGDFLLHLDLPMRGLPEFDILDDICPPWIPGRRGQLEIARLLTTDDGCAAERAEVRALEKKLIGLGRALQAASTEDQRLALEEQIRDVELDLHFAGLALSECLQEGPTGSRSFVRDWISAGPRNVSGRIKSLAIHPADSNTVYAGAANGGVWVTNNGGLTWRPLMERERSLAIGALGISESNPQVIYAATGEDTGVWLPSYPGVGVYKSTDAGDTWNLLAPISSNVCTRVLVHPTNPDIVYVAGAAGLHRSTNGGTTWTNVRTDHVSDALLDPYAPDTIYAAVWNSGIFLSTNGGAAWSDYSSGLPTGGNADWIKLAVSRDGNSDTPYLVAKMGPGSGELYESHESRTVIRPHGSLWSRIPGTHQGVLYNEWTNLVALDPGNHNILFAGAVGLERSSDGGRTFTLVGGTHADHQAIVFDRNNTSICYMATDGGVYRSTDNGVTWTLRSTNLTATQLYSIGVSQATPFVLGGATQDQGIIKTGGSLDWVDTGAGYEGGFFIVDPNSSSNIYVSPPADSLTTKPYSILRRSTNGGLTWDTLLNGLPQVNGHLSIVVGHLAVKPGDSNVLLCVGANQVFRSTDQGTNWSSVLSITGSFTRVVFHADGVTCYATTDVGSVFCSKNGGASGTWSEPYTMANAPPAHKIATVEARTRGGFLPISHIIYIAYSGYAGAPVYKSIDSGAHWENASGSGAGALPAIPVNALVIDQYSSDTVYIATDIGVFLTSDGGSSWQPFVFDSLPRIMVTDMVLQKNTNTLYVSTMGRGAYRRSL